LTAQPENDKKKENRGVAQSGSVPEWGSGGRWFKSSRPDHKKSLPAGKMKAISKRIPPERKPSVLLFPSLNPAGEKMKAKALSFFMIALFPLVGGCITGSVQKELVWSKDFQPKDYQCLAVIDTDPQIQFGEYVKAELLKKGYQIREKSMVRQMVKKGELIKEEISDLSTLTKIGKMLKVQGIVLCSVSEFSRFRDFYSLSIKMVAPETGNILWIAQGSTEGKRGQKTSELLKRIVYSILKTLPPVP
jgi:hypothetical protein